MWEWRNGGCSQQADKDLSGAPIWGQQEEGVGAGQFAWHSWGMVGHTLRKSAHGILPPACGTGQCRMSRRKEIQ